MEGAEIDYANCIQQNWHEILNYCTKTGHLAALNVAMINRAKFESYPEDIQTILWECADEAMDFNHEQRAASDEMYYNELVDAGVEVIELEPAELAKMKEACASIYQDFIDLGCEDIIDEVAEVDASYAK